MINESDAALFSHLAYTPSEANLVDVPQGWERQDHRRVSFIDR